MCILLRKIGYFSILSTGGAVFQKTWFYLLKNETTPEDDCARVGLLPCQ